MTDYLVATIKPWNVEAFHRHSPTLPGQWHLVETPEDLESAIRTSTPRYVFFPHWSWRVPTQVLEQIECVCFHMTDVPYGRGGSPLQNLILRGHDETMLSALRMVETLDAGPVYGQRKLSLEGRAQHIYERAANLTYELIAWIVTENPEPERQQGQVVEFRRRRPEESHLPHTDNPRVMCDHIRMLDAATYPHAYIRHGPWRIEFTEAQTRGDQIVGRFHMRREDDEGD
jgi:methionyl-tRNA formyltransferase